MERGYWIRSKPVYSTLIWNQQATAHLVVAEGVGGGMAVLKLFQQMHPEHPITVLYADHEQGSVDYSATLQRVVPEGLQVYATDGAALQAVKAYLPQARMGLRIYVAGSEKFMWEIAGICTEYGIENDEICKELTGTLARSVYCVHCKGITHDVHSNVTPCVDCGRMLFVRDHFSRRLGAYMGLMVDAEAPGVLPEIEEIYP